MFFVCDRPMSGAPTYNTGGPSYNTGPPQADMFSRRPGGAAPVGGYQVGAGYGFVSFFILLFLQTLTFKPKNFQLNFHLADILKATTDLIHTLLLAVLAGK